MSVDVLREDGAFVRRCDDVCEARSALERIHPAIVSSRLVGDTILLRFPGSARSYTYRLVAVTGEEAVA